MASMWCVPIVRRSVIGKARSREQQSETQPKDAGGMSRLLGKN